MPEPRDLSAVNLPPVSAGAISAALERESERQRVGDKAKFFSDIQTAGDRARALDVVKNYSGKFRNSRDFTIAFRAVDEFYPEPQPPSKEVRGISVYDEKTGRETQAFVPSTETPLLNDPAEVKRRFGSTATLTKPAEKETGAKTPRERATEFGRSLINDATRITAISLGAALGADGNYYFDDDTRTGIFNERLRYIERLVEIDPNFSKKPQAGISLATEAAKLYPLPSETPKPAETKPAPKKDEPGLLSGAVDKVKRAITGKPEKPAAQGDIGAQITAKVKEINARTDLKPEQKKAALDKLREIARKNKAKVDF